MTTFTNNDHHTPGEKLRLMSHHQPAVSIFLQPIAPPAALGLAGFAGSTWITASWIANWWGSPDSPSIFFPFVAFFGGLAQFIAGLYGFHARDTLVSVINTMWGSFWISVGLLYLLVATKVLPSHSIYTQFPELASWFVILAVFTWSGAIAACARDLVLAALLFCLATGSTIACCLFSTGAGIQAGIKIAAYFWMASALLAWYRVTVYLMEENFGPESTIMKFFPIFRTPMEMRAPLVMPGLGEPGVKRGVPKMVARDSAYGGITAAHDIGNRQSAGLGNGAANGATNGDLAHDGA